MLASCHDSLWCIDVTDGNPSVCPYALVPCGCRCSETGAAFFNDMMSKHAMHSGGQEEVLYAGEHVWSCCATDSLASQHMKEESLLSSWNSMHDRHVMST